MKKEMIIAATMMGVVGVVENIETQEVRAENINQFKYKEIEIDGEKGIEINRLEGSYKNIKIPKEIEGKPVWVVKIEDSNVGEIDLKEAENIQQLMLNNNDLVEIDVTNLTELEKLVVSSNRLSSLDVSKNLKLRELNVSYNFLNELDLSKLEEIVNLNIANNRLMNIKINQMKNLETLNAFKNELDSLNVKGISGLKILSLSENRIKKLEMDGLPELITLDLEKNPITELNLSELIKLRTLDISNTKIESIDYSNLMNLRTFNFNLLKLSLMEYEKLISEKGHLRSITEKPSIFFETTGSESVKVTLKDYDSDIEKVEISWTKDGEQVEKWDVYYDLKESYEKDRWIFEKTSGYGVYYSGNVIEFSLPEKYESGHYRFNVKVTDIDGTVSIKQSQDIYVKQESLGSKSEGEIEKGSLTFKKGFYEAVIGEITVRVPKENVNNQNPKVKIRELNGGIKKIEFELGEKNKEMKRMEIDVLKQEEKIAYEINNGQKLFVPQMDKGEKITLKIDRDMDIVFENGMSNDFSDIPSNHYSKTSVENLVKFGVVKGVSEKNYGGAKEITRAEFAVLLSRVLGLEVSNDKEMTFKDVKKGEWYSAAIQSLYEAGYIAGKTANTFGPNDKITRQDAAVLMSRLINRNAELSSTEEKIIPDMSNVSNYAKVSVQQLRNLGIINGVDSKGNFKPLNNITRYEMAAILNNTLKKIEFL